MSFSKKIKNISKRLKIILFIFALFLLLSAGTLTILAQNGSFASFADEITQVATSAVTDKVAVTVTVLGSDKKPITNTAGLVQAFSESSSVDKNINSKGEAYFSLVPAKYS